MAWPIIIIHIWGVIRGIWLRSGWRRNDAGVAGSVASARAAKVLRNWNLSALARAKAEEGSVLHDKIDPKKLDGSEHTLFFVWSDGGNKSNNDGGNVDRNLELAEHQERSTTYHKIDWRINLLVRTSWPNHWRIYPTWLHRQYLRNCRPWEWYQKPL